MSKINKWIDNIFVEGKGNQLVIISDSITVIGLSEIWFSDAFFIGLSDIWLAFADFFFHFL